MLRSGSGSVAYSRSPRGRTRPDQEGAGQRIPVNRRIPQTDIPAKPRITASPLMRSGRRCTARVEVSGDGLSGSGGTYASASFRESVRYQTRCHVLVSGPTPRSSQVRGTHEARTMTSTMPAPALFHVTVRRGSRRTRSGRTLGRSDLLEGGLPSWFSPRNRVARGTEPSNSVGDSQGFRVLPEV